MYQDCIAFCISLPGTCRLFFLWLRFIFSPAQMTKLAKIWYFTPLTLADVSLTFARRLKGRCLLWMPLRTPTFGGVAGEARCWARRGRDLGRFISTPL
jgi:hypothetical protein